MSQEHRNAVILSITHNELKRFLNIPEEFELIGARWSLRTDSLSVYVAGDRLPLKHPASRAYTIDYKRSEKPIPVQIEDSLRKT